MQPLTIEERSNITFVKKKKYIYIYNTYLVKTPILALKDDLSSRAAIKDL